MRKSVGFVAVICALVACDSGGKNRAAATEVASTISGVAAAANNVALSSGVSSAVGQGASSGVAGIEYGSEDFGAAAVLSSPSGIAIDTAGNVYVADTGNAIIRKFTPAGLATILAGTPRQPGYADGTGVTARFDQPMGLAVDAAGNVYVADSGNNVIRKITPSGLVTTLAGAFGEQGDANGTGAAARFNRPCGVATDTAGNVYVADTGNDIIRKITPIGGVSTLAGASGESGLADGMGASAKFFEPFGITVDRASNIYVTDSLANNPPRKITPAGKVTTLNAVNEKVLARGDDGDGLFESQARMIGPAYGIALDSEGDVYVATDDSIVRKITSKGSMTDFALFTELHSTTNHRFTSYTTVYDTQLHGIAIDSTGNIYVAATNKHTIYRITPACVATILAGTPKMAGDVSCEH